MSSLLVLRLGLGLTELVFYHTTLSRRFCSVDASTVVVHLIGHVAAGTYVGGR